MATPLLLRIRKPEVPDNSSYLAAFFKDFANPLVDSYGGIIYTDILDENGDPIPEYPEFSAWVSIPTGQTIDAALIADLMAQALAQATAQAQIRADNLVIQAAVRPLLTAYPAEV